jgi:hypothetical protein
MDRQLIVLGPRDALDSFEQVASEASFDVSRSQLHPLAAGPVNAAEFLQLAFSKEGAAMFIALAAVIRAYLSSKSSRRITITKMESDRIGALDARGFSKEELAEILPKCRELIVYEDKPKKAKMIKASAP